MDQRHLALHPRGMKRRSSQQRNSHSALARLAPKCGKGLTVDLVFGANDFFKPNICSSPT
jgi:hypothetical protein